MLKTNREFCGWLQCSSCGNAYLDLGHTRGLTTSIRYDEYFSTNVGWQHVMTPNDDDLFGELTNTITCNTVDLWSKSLYICLLVWTPQELRKDRKQKGTILLLIHLNNIMDNKFIYGKKGELFADVIRNKYVNRRARMNVKAPATFAAGVMHKRRHTTPRLLCDEIIRNLLCALNKLW